MERMHKGCLMFPLSLSSVHRKDMVTKQSVEGKVGGGEGWVGIKRDQSRDRRAAGVEREPEKPQE